MRIFLYKPRQAAPPVSYRPNHSYFRDKFTRPSIHRRYFGSPRDKLTVAMPGSDTANSNLTYPFRSQKPIFSFKFLQLASRTRITLQTTCNIAKILIRVYILISSSFFGTSLRGTKKKQRSLFSYTHTYIYIYLCIIQTRDIRNSTQFSIFFSSLFLRCSLFIPRDAFLDKTELKHSVILVQYTDK